MVKEEEKQQGMEAQIESALRSRIQHFKDNADSLTLESVRRLLEKDLGLEKYALDVHKRFIKQLMEKLLEDPDDDASKNSVKDVKKNFSSTKTEAAESPKKNETKKNLKQPASEDEMKTEDSPIMGLMTTTIESVDAQSAEPSESKIKKAIWDRASHILDNSEIITPSGVRRLLEEDLGLPPNALDPFKKFIRTQIDEVLESSKVSESATGSKKKKSSGNSQIDVSEKNIFTSSGSLDYGKEEVDEKVKSRKKAAVPRENISKSEGLKKRKGPQKEVNVSSKKPKKLAEEPLDEADDDSGSDDLLSEVSSEKPSKKKQVSTPGYGKRVENLRSIIKACGMSVAPSVYKKAKQVSDHKREAFLIKELEEILSRERLSANPTEKEIKEVKKRKERARELEGIDISNIVSSSRRRTTMTFMAPPKPKVHVEVKVDKSKSTKKTKNDESDDGDVDNETQGKKEEEEKEEKEEEEKEEKEEEKEEKEEEKEAEEEKDDADDEDDDDDSDADSQSEEFNDDDEDSD